MTTGRLSIETMDNYALAIINCDNGDHHEIAGVSYNNAFHRSQDFCKANQIILNQMPHREGSKPSSCISCVLEQYRF